MTAAKKKTGKKRLGGLGCGVEVWNWAMRRPGRLFGSLWYGRLAARGGLLTGRMSHYGFKSGRWLVIG